MDTISIEKLSTYAFECEKEYRELKNKYTEALKTIEKLQTKMNDKFNSNISYEIEDLSSKTIDRVVWINGEWGRTYSKYIGFMCSDGSRILIAGTNPYNPTPELKDMVESKFYNDTEIQTKQNEIEYRKKQREREAKEAKEREFKRLQKELDKGQLNNNFIW